MIGRRCKARERLSRAPLIGRALRDTYKVPSAPDRSQRASSPSAVRPPGRPSDCPPLRSPRRNAPRGPAATAAGAPPDPYRTRKLSRPAPRVLQGRPCGRLGRRRPPGRVARAQGGEARHEHLGEGDPSGSPSFVCGAFRDPAKADGPPAPEGGGRPFRVRGRPARIPCAGLPCGQRRRRPFDMSRTSSRGNNRPGLTLRARPGLFIYPHPVCRPLSRASVRRSSCCLMAARGACAPCIS